MKPPGPLIPLVLTGCHMDSDFHRRVQHDVFRQEARAEVDVLFVVDSSESMEEEQARLAARFDDFIVYLDQVETKLDFHLGVVTMDIEADNPERGHLLGYPAVLTRDVAGYVELFKERVQVGIDGSHWEQGLESSFMAVSEPLASDVNQGFLRPDAQLVLIYVSDENDCSDRGALPSEDYCYLEAYQDDLVPVTTFADDFRAIKGRRDGVLAFAIVGPPDTSACEDTVPGFRYQDLADHLGGASGSICTEDFAGIMGDLGLTVSGVRSTFPLSYAAVEETIEVWVCWDDPCEDGTGYAVSPSESDGWTYSEQTTNLTFHGDAVPDRGTVIYVTYEVAGSAAEHTGEPG
jgi:hypothetical protein